jgi:hypothetical protein
MDEKRQMLRHFLAALAYRTQKALRGAPSDFSSFRAEHNVRNPHELIRHMDSVLGYARTHFIGGTYRPPEFSEFKEAVLHFHGVLADLARHLELGTEFKAITPEVLKISSLPKLASGTSVLINRFQPHPTQTGSRQSDVSRATNTACRLS